MSLEARRHEGKREKIDVDSGELYKWLFTYAAARDVQSVKEVFEKYNCDYFKAEAGRNKLMNFLSSLEAAFQKISSPKESNQLEEIIIVISDFLNKNEQAAA